MKSVWEQALRKGANLTKVGKGKDSVVFRFKADDGSEHVLKFSPRPPDNAAVSTAMKALGRTSTTNKVDHPDNPQARKEQKETLEQRGALLTVQTGLQIGKLDLTKKRKKLKGLLIWKMGTNRSKAIQQINAYDQQIKAINSAIEKNEDKIDFLQEKNTLLQHGINENTKNIDAFKQKIGGADNVDPQHVSIEPWMGDVILDGDAQWAPLESDQALDVISQSMDDLGKLHEKGLVHGDIAPTNTSTRGLIDIEGFKHGHPATIDTRGTAGYTGPEYTAVNADSGRQITKENDVYAMGMLMHDMLDTYNLHDKLPATTSTLIDQMTALDPEKRPPIAECREAWAKVRQNAKLPQQSAATERFTNPRFDAAVKTRHALASTYASLPPKTEQSDEHNEAKNSDEPNEANKIDEAKEKKIAMPDASLRTISGMKQHNVYLQSLSQSTSTSKMYLGRAQRTLSTITDTTLKSRAAKDPSTSAAQKTVSNTTDTTPKSEGEKSSSASASQETVSTLTDTTLKSGGEKKPSEDRADTQASVTENRTPPSNDGAGGGEVEPSASASQQKSHSASSSASLPKTLSASTSKARPPSSRHSSNHTASSNKDDDVAPLKTTTANKRGRSNTSPSEKQTPTAKKQRQTGRPNELNCSSAMKEKTCNTSKEADVDTPKADTSSSNSM